SGVRGYADVVQAVALAVHADVIARAGRRWRRRRPVRERLVQVLALEHLAESLGAPVGHEELQPRPAAKAAVAVVAEESGHPGPYVRDLLWLDEDTEPPGHHGAGGQAAPDPQVEAWRAVRADDTHEGDVVNLVGRALRAASGDRRLVLARQVHELGVE